MSLLVPLDMSEKVINGLKQNSMETNKWISVKDRLPEEGQKVIVFDNEYKTVDTYEFEDSKFLYRDSYHTDDYTNFVTHWMPLPKPPINDCRTCQGLIIGGCCDCNENEND